MKKILVAIALQSLCQVCGAADESDRSGFKVWRNPFGSGTPALNATVGTETAHHVADGSYHVPNYLPGYPTAATIWPREVEVECDLDLSRRKLVCDGYAIRPALGRGEYVLRSSPGIAATRARHPLRLLRLRGTCASAESGASLAEETARLTWSWST